MAATTKTDWPYLIIALLLGFGATTIMVYTYNLTTALYLNKNGTRTRGCVVEAEFYGRHHQWMIYFEFADNNGKLYRVMKISQTRRSVGDDVDIFYDPQNPYRAEIAPLRSGSMLRDIPLLLLVAGCPITLAIIMLWENRTRGRGKVPEKGQLF